MRTKVTVGFVVQTFDDNGRCVSQEFSAGDTVGWEDNNGEPLDVQHDCEYFPFKMVQPWEIKDETDNG